ncbi:MAG TPA: hypothetical protein VE967_06985, partial [Gemmatimonadaceae bacterium]|nr:hypothetical protein [Gemmatimonadaceae bacterium]
MRSEWLDRVDADKPCSLRQVRIERGRGVSSAAACALTREAIARIGTGAGSAAGVLPADTAGVAASHVTYFAFRDLSGG